MRIRINKNDSIEYLKVVDSPSNHKRMVIIYDNTLNFATANLSCL